MMTAKLEAQKLCYSLGSQIADLVAKAVGRLLGVYLLGVCPVVQLLKMFPEHQREIYTKD